MATTILSPEHRMWTTDYFATVSTRSMILGPVYLVKARPATRGTPKVNDAPLEILKRRYAAGEISAEEFMRTRRELTQARRFP